MSGPWKVNTADIIPTATQYYKAQFPKDMSAFRGFYARKAEPRHGVVVSIVDLIPFLPGGKNCDSVQRRPRPHRICFCLFFVTLLDQALYSTIGENHNSFFERVRHPKLHGFLGSSHSIVHPVFALLAGTLHIHRAGIEDLANADFEELAVVLRAEYRRVLAEEIPDIGDPASGESGYARKAGVYEAIATALTRGEYPTDLKAFLPSGEREEADAALVDRWVNVFRAALAE